MRIGIIGASGRVGTRLVETIIASPGMELAAALVSPASPLVGRSVAGGSLEYRAADAAIRSHCDAMIDFSAPAASLAFQELLGDIELPVVIGTTGFTDEEDMQLTAYAKRRPLLAGANFAAGFEAFRRAAIDFSRRMPGAEPSVLETYHARKKAVPSGTSRLLAASLTHERSRVMGFKAPRTPITVRREGDTVGVNEVRFSLASGTVSLNYTVHTLAAYAEGAIAAAQWLVAKAPGNGRFELSDTLTE